MDIAITKMSSKGQIVIPAEMRKTIQKDEKFIIIKHEEQFILKNVSDLDSNFEADLEFAKKTGEAFNQYSNGTFIKKNKQEFIDGLDEW